MPSLKELSKKPELLTGGHRLCAGCAEPIIVRQVLLAADSPVIVATPTGCLEVSTTIFPYTAWKVPWIHCAFENAAATLSGVEGLYRVFKRQGKIKENVKFIAFAGDGGTYDIGFQSLSGALERGHHLLYVCLDNQAYMNTGIQRSSATPLGAWTTTSPVGKVLAGKPQTRKDLTACVAAHNPAFVAQASPSHWNDLVTKAQKALKADGHSFINVISPCPRGWRYAAEQTIKIAKMAVDTCFWPLYEIANGKYKLNYKPKEKLPVIEWLKTQRRFAHLLKPENKAIIDELQTRINQNWENLLAHSAAQAD